MHRPLKCLVNKCHRVDVVVPAVSRLQKRTVKFKRESDILPDDPNFGRPETVTIEEYIYFSRHMTMYDTRLTADQIANAIYLSRKRVPYILHTELRMP